MAGVLRRNARTSFGVPSPRQTRVSLSGITVGGNAYFLVGEAQGIPPYPSLVARLNPGLISIRVWSSFGLGSAVGMGRFLSTEECLRYASEYLTKAQAASDRNLRNHCLTLAKEWMELAVELDKETRVEFP